MIIRETTHCLSRFTLTGVVSATLPLAALDGRGTDGATSLPNPTYAPATVELPLKSANRRMRNLAEQTRPVSDR